MMSHESGSRPARPPQGAGCGPLRLPHVSVEVAAFEQWTPPETPFDVVVAATAFHWLDPATVIDKIAGVLRSGGWLATVTTAHIAGGSEAFFRDVQDCYERWDPATPPGLRLTTAQQVAADHGDTRLAHRFEPPIFRRHEREITYTTAGYLDLLLTYSNHRALPLPSRRSLLDCIARCADEHGGSITKRYLHELRVTKRRANSTAHTAVTDRDQGVGAR